MNVGLSGKIVVLISFGCVNDVVLSDFRDSTVVLSADVEVADQPSIRFTLAEAKHFSSIDDKRRVAVVYDIASQIDFHVYKFLSVRPNALVQQRRVSAVR